VDQKNGYCYCFGCLRINISTICYYFRVTDNKVLLFKNLPDIPKYVLLFYPTFQNTYVLFYHSNPPHVFLEILVP
jgi:hypothetical protein